MLDLKQIDMAISQISTEKKISKESLLEIIEAAITTAYKKDFWNKDEDIRVKLNMKEERIEITQYKKLVDEIEDRFTEMTREDLKKEVWEEDAELFDIWEMIEFDLSDTINTNTANFGRIASQAARQVIIQKLQDNEKIKICKLFEWKEWTIINLKVDLADRNKVYLEYNWDTMILPKKEQVSRDKYTPGQRLYFYIDRIESEIEWQAPEVVITRKSPDLVRLLFELNSPELQEWIIEIDDIVRIPGSRTKMIVQSNVEWLDAAGSLIWPKWSRVRLIVDELFWERIDIINYSDDMAELIKNALSPAKVNSVIVDDSKMKAVCYLDADEKARAVWKWWQNVTLVHKLTGYDIEIKTEDER